MPPPRKKIKLNVDAKPGLLRQHLNSPFNLLPTGDELLNGHVLYLYLSNNSTLSQTEEAIKRTFSQEQAPVLPELKNKIRGLVNRTIKKFRKLSNTSEFDRFNAICSEPFLVTCTFPSGLFICSNEVIDLASSTDDGYVPSPSYSNENVSSPSTITNGLSSVSKLHCSSCDKLRERLKAAIQQKVHMRKQHIITADVLRAKLRKKQTVSVRVLNQKVKRKDIQIEKLKSIKSSTCGCNCKAKIRNLTRKNKRLEGKCSHQSVTIHEAADREINVMKDKLQTKDDQISILEDQNIILEEQVESLANTETFVKEGRTFSKVTRLFVYDAVVNQVPTGNIPKLLERFVKRTGPQLDIIPHRNTVEMMVRELGVISELQTAEAILENSDSTLGFDATTQEGVHVNSVHVTFKSRTQGPCLVTAVDELPGGTAEEYIIYQMKKIC